MRVELQPAYVLHARPYSDSSLILDCFTEEFGRLSLLAKGARNPKSRQRQLCQPFQPLILSWQGKSDLKTLTHIELQGSNYQFLQGDYLYSGFYLNELLIRTLSVGDSAPGVYQLYRTALGELLQQAPLEPALRRFELALLAEAGYAVDLQREADHQTPLRSQACYHWYPEAGWVAVPGDATGTFEGAHLLAIGRDELDNSDVLKSAKRLSRMLLKPLLGDKPLRSRELFGPRNHKGELQ
ncbi:DNA repair protein RecO [Pseudomaricurvus sp. HS19]|uniref:DNA repair protein RecO n=1 Tax=Pseudomaricurvus sp. HS19 TaxID=2692626 RepID=UPI0013718495|nr:DNA repair protein RecO [Pseudomaricurvus sp. HS19]MYM62585.1 DNA repair protein RecO [Pseudomaricurvus sp. HS19]